MNIRFAHKFTTKIFQNFLLWSNKMVFIVASFSFAIFFIIFSAETQAFISITTNEARKVKNIKFSLTVSRQPVESWKHNKIAHEFYALKRTKYSNFFVRKKWNCWVYFSLEISIFLVFPLSKVPETFSFK